MRQRVTYNLLDLTMMGRAMRLEEPMPDLTKTPTVHLATVVSNWEPDYTDNRENGSQPSVTVRLDRYTKLPRLGDRIVVSSSTEGIFAWIREQTQAREDVLSAAIAWLERGGPALVPWSRDATTLRDAVLVAQGLRTGFDRGAPEGDRTAERPAPSEATDPGVDLARRVAEAVGGDREVTVIIVGEI